MILNSNGRPTSSAADAVSPPADVPPPVPQKQRKYKPAPGKVIVKRHEAARQFEHGSLKLERHSAFVERDDAFEIYATVLEVGEPSAISGEPWFSRGQNVTLEPSLFRDVHLTPDYVVWCGPYAGIIGTFEDEEETDNAE